MSKCLMVTMESVIGVVTNVRSIVLHVTEAQGNVPRVMGVTSPRPCRERIERKMFA